MSTENVNILITADADQMIRETNQAVRELKEIGKAAQKAGSDASKSLGRIEFTAVAVGLKEIGKAAIDFGKATYDMARAWRDAHAALGTASGGVRVLSEQVTEAEESVRRMNDVAGTMAAAMTSAVAPTLKGAYIAMASFAALTLRASVEVAYLRDTLADWLISLYDQNLGVKSANLTLDDYRRGVQNAKDLVEAWTTSTETQQEAQETSNTTTRRATAQTQEMSKAIREMVDAKNADIAASVARAQAEADAQAAAVAKIKEEAMLRAQSTRSQAEANAQQAEADAETATVLANRKKASNDIVVSSAVETASAIAGLVKDGTKEAAVAQKAAALFAVTVNTIQGASKAIAELGPLGIPAAAAIGALGAAQAAAIASAPLPSFDRGGVVDGGPQYPGGRPGQRLAQVEDGEMVLTRKMQEAMGQQGSQTVILRVGSREFGRAVIDSGATDGLQRRRGVGQRRYGG